MVFEIMRNEKSYDILPNFTAADVFLYLGIGRNQYIDIMNKARSKKWTWKLSRNFLKEMLPTQPLSFNYGYWWFVDSVPIPQQEFSQKIFPELSEEEKLSIAQVKKDGRIMACKLPLSCVDSLFKKGLIYFNVFIEDNDHIVVPPLKNFIMNRQPDSYYEKLLYDILVTLDERTTPLELANTLEVPLETIKSAISLYCRLDFAKKKIPNIMNNIETNNNSASENNSMTLNSNSELNQKFHNSWASSINEYHTILALYSTIPNIDDAAVNSSKKIKRIGFLFDSSLTAYLMMGNLAVGLKNHAVTLFEVGKMPDELLDEFLTHLSKIETKGENEGEAQKYYKHAIAIRETLKFLRYNAAFKLQDCDGGVDMVRCESLNNLDSETKLRVLDSNYSILIAMAPLQSGSLVLPSCIPKFYGPPLHQVSTPWFRLYLYHCLQQGPVSVFFVKGKRIRRYPPMFRKYSRLFLQLWNQEGNMIQAKTLLQVLNDSLAYSPAFIQDIDVEQLVDVPFPYLETGNEKLSKLMGAVIEKFHLEYSFGVLKVLKLAPPVKDSSSVLGISEDVDYIPVELMFGMPLSSEAINSQVSKAIVEKNLFLPDNIREHSQKMKLMCSEFLTFIDEMLDQNLRITRDNLPSSSIFFDGRKIDMKIDIHP